MLAGLMFFDRPQPMLESILQKCPHVWNLYQYYELLNQNILFSEVKRNPILDIQCPKNGNLQYQNEI